MTTAVFACSAGSGGGSTASGGSGSGGSGTNGDGGTINLTGGSSNSGGSLNLPGGGTTGTGGTPTDPDPANPYIAHPACGAKTCENFPEAAILGEGVPANAADLFGAADNMTSGALCVTEPQLSNGAVPGVMIPANWVRPRFRWNATGMDLFEIRISSPAQRFDLVAYTKQTTWYLPKEIWAGPGTPGVDNVPASGNGAANNGAGQPFTVTIRGINSAAPSTPIGIKGDFNVAPVVGTGSMVFWTVNSAQVTPESSKLLGFAIGDEGVAEALNLQQLEWTGQLGEDGAVLRGYYDEVPVAGFENGEVRCMGCHVSTPDGKAVVFTDDWPWSKAVASIEAGSAGTIPSYVTPGGEGLLKLPWLGTQSMSPALWSDTKKLVITSYGVETTSGVARATPWFAPNYDGGDKVTVHQLAWFDLMATADIPTEIMNPSGDYGSQALQDRQNGAALAEGSGWGLIATGDTESAVSPSVNRAGDAIAYVTTDFSPDGHPDYTATTADIKVVPFNGGDGGAGMPLAGASDPNFLEYYPSYSADDKFIAFTRAPAVSAQSPDGPYYNRFGEIMVIPAAGGTPTRLAANDPNSCNGDDVSRGIINSWPKWSPNAVKYAGNGKTYYFLIFSSGRKYGDEFSEQFQIPKSDASAFQGLTDSSQLYLATIVVDEATGAIETYPALYIWNQNRLATNGMATKLAFSNLTPAWDPFELPPIDIPEVPVEPPPQ